MAQQQTLSTVSRSAQQVLAVTTQAWRVQGLSAHALARRAPHGYEPVRSLRRVRATAAATAEGRSFIAHSW